MSQRILLVDDDENILTVLEESLLQEGYEVITAMSAGGALKKVETGLPNLAILDVNLPDMTGYDLTQTLKNAEATKHIPIIIITAGTTKPLSEDERQARGIDAFLLKPFSMRALSETVAGLLGPAA